MKKAIISLMLALALVFSLVLVAAPVAEATTHTNHCVCGGKTVGVGDHATCTTEATWVDLNAALEASVQEMNHTATSGKNFYALPSGNYYLSDDLTDLAYEIAPLDADGTITVCLNGFTVTSSAIRTFYLFGNRTLNICDCAGNGKIVSTKASDGSVIYAKENAVVNVFGGTINGSTSATGAGGTIRINSAATSMNMYGGTIKGGATTSLGGNIYVAGTANLYGGTVSGGVAKNTGGNIHLVDGAKLVIDGASVTGGKDSEGQAANDIYVAGTGKVTVKSIAGEMKIGKSADSTVELTGLDTAYTKTGTDTAFTLTYKAPAGGSTTPGGSNNPATGDSANLVVMGLGLVLGVAGMACLLPKKHNG